MDFQEPDPIREYLINEMLKNIIYIGLHKEKERIEKKISKTLSNNKKLILKKELELLKEDIRILSTNKTEKYNQIIYKRFSHNLGKIKKIIYNNKKSFQELINNYLYLIESGNINKNPSLINKQLQHIRNKLRTYISTIPPPEVSDSDNTLNLETYKQSLFEIDKNLDELSSNKSEDISDELLE